MSQIQLLLPSLVALTEAGSSWPIFVVEIPIQNTLRIELEGEDLRPC